jgi:hypothetical protein
MAYFVKKLLGKGKLRDGVTIDDPFKEIFDDCWVEFKHLPRGHRVGINHGGVEVVESDEKDALEKLNFPFRNRNAERVAHEKRVQDKIAGWDKEWRARAGARQPQPVPEQKSIMEKIAERTQQDVKKKPVSEANKTPAGRTKITSVKTK